MDWVSHTVSAFGQSVGIPDLQLDADGCALFALQPSGTLCLYDLSSSDGDDVLVILAKPLPVPAPACARRALRMADFRVNPTFQIQLAMRGEDLVATLRIPRPSFLPSTLEGAVDTLFDFHSRVAQAD